MSITEIFSYGFMQRALLSGLLVGVLCAVLGVFLVLRRLSLIGDGLAHVTFGSVALALALKTNPVYVTIAALQPVLPAAPSWPGSPAGSMSICSAISSAIFSPSATSSSTWR